MLRKETIPVGVFVAYFVLFIAAVVTQFTLIFVFGYTQADEIRLGALSNLIGYGTAFILLYVLYFKYLKGKIVDACKNYKTVLAHVAIGFMALYLVGTIISLIYSALGYGTPDNQATLDTYANAAMFDKVSLAIFAVLLAPFVEEMVFRAGIMGITDSILKQSTKLSKEHIAGIGIVISAFLFGLVHVIGDIEQIFNYAGLGLILGYIYYRTDNIYTSVLCHMLYNGIAAYVMFFM